MKSNPVSQIDKWFYDFEAKELKEIMSKFLCLWETYVVSYRKS